MMGKYLNGTICQNSYCQWIVIGVHNTYYNVIETPIRYMLGNPYAKLFGKSYIVVPTYLCIVR